jgi:hypothetical protein
MVSQIRIFYIDQPGYSSIILNTLEIFGAKFTLNWLCYNLKQNGMEEDTFNLSASDLQQISRQPLHPAAILGFSLFNRHKYFEAHEALETAWKAEPGPIRELYRGILQVGVACYHIQRGNYSGARKMILRARRWLGPFPEICCGILINRLKTDLDRVEEELVRLGPGRIDSFDPGLFKPIEFESKGKTADAR